MEKLKNAIQKATVPFIAIGGLITILIGYVMTGVYFASNVVKYFGFNAGFWFLIIWIIFAIFIVLVAHYYEQD